MFDHKRLLAYIQANEPSDILMPGEFDRALAVYRDLAERDVPSRKTTARTLAKMQVSPSDFFEAVGKIEQELQARHPERLTRTPRRSPLPFVELAVFACLPIEAAPQLP